MHDPFRANSTSPRRRSGESEASCATKTKHVRPSTERFRRSKIQLSRSRDRPTPVCDPARKLARTAQCKEVQRLTSAFARFREQAVEHGAVTAVHGHRSADGEGPWGRPPTTVPCVTCHRRRCKIAEYSGLQLEGGDL